MQQKAIVNTNWAVVVSPTRSLSLLLSLSISRSLLALRVCELIGKLLTTYAYVKYTEHKHRHNLARVHAKVLQAP